MMRLAEAHARLCCQDEVREVDAMVAIWLVEQTLVRAKPPFRCPTL